MHGARTEYIGTHNCSHPPTDLSTYRPTDPTTDSTETCAVGFGGYDLRLTVQITCPFLPRPTAHLHTYLHTYQPSYLQIQHPPASLATKRKRIDSERIRRQDGLHRWMDQMGMLSQRLCTLSVAASFVVHDESGEMDNNGAHRPQPDLGANGAGGMNS
jgi:hypothetical protein